MSSTRIWRPDAIGTAAMNKTQYFASVEKQLDEVATAWKKWALDQVVTWHNLDPLAHPDVIVFDVDQAKTAVIDKHRANHEQPRTMAVYRWRIQFRFDRGDDE